MAITVTGLAIAPVKATRLQAVDRVTLESTGVRENRRFFLIDGRDRMVNATNLGQLEQVLADYADSERRLRLTFPDGRVLEDTIRLGEPVQARFYSDALAARLVEGPWAQALSELTGKSLRLVEPEEGGAVDRRDHSGTVSLISRSSLARLADVGGQSDVDGRRFRMLIEVDGVAAHAEDGWVGRRVQIGEARVEFTGHVGRCLITSRNPETGAIDLPTLDMLRSYRRDAEATEPLPFGIYGRVLEVGPVAVGDAVIPDG
jgi:MOSC domain-containing protein